MIGIEINQPLEDAIANLEATIENLKTKGITEENCSDVHREFVYNALKRLKERRN